MTRIQNLKSVDGEEYLAIDEAASFLGIKESAIRNYLSLGKFTTYKFKSLTLLKISELDRWKPRQKKRTNRS
jgi:excisionase family DNA binding protein